jgi:hypothetical protein
VSESEDYFRFDLNLWRKAFRYEAVTPPDDADIRMVVDPSYSSEPTSDPTAILVGYKYNNGRNGALDTNILDGAKKRLKGIQLPEEIIRLARLWKVTRIGVERQGPGAYDLLYDCVQLLTKDDPIYMFPFNPENKLRAKPRRIRNIQTELLEPEPQALRIYCPALIDPILEEAENFVFESGTNLERSDDLLDCIALMSFRGEI